MHRKQSAAFTNQAASMFRDHAPGLQENIRARRILLSERSQLPRGFLSRVNTPPKKTVKSIRQQRQGLMLHAPVVSARIPSFSSCLQYLGQLHQICHSAQLSRTQNRCTVVHEVRTNRAVSQRLFLRRSSTHGDPGPYRHWEQEHSFPNNSRLFTLVQTPIPATPFF